MENELVICCMDRRLNNFLENEYGSAIVIRNAGANAAPIMQMAKRIVEDNDIGAITLITHDDCGAMGKVYSVLKNGGSATEDLKEALINQFNGVNFSTREELEEKNTELQLNALKKEFKDIKVVAKPVKMSNIKVPEDTKEHKLLVFSPGKPDYSRAFKSLGFEPWQCYVVQGSVGNTLPDMELAVTDLHAKDVSFIVGNKDNPRDVKRDLDMASLRLSGIGAEVKRCDIRSVKKNFA
ncbi:hypothetical protein M1373_02280 [Candidatus Marsarchaeota archaeon]|nr:hypothetical protein [Candidatus Marsarchaeota archaeon]MCL5404846.1 hypothetical protein [Candidatus Marsarchaeota archaeon]